jgi:hypothetical protein
MRWVYLLIALYMAIMLCMVSASREGFTDPDQRVRAPCVCDSSTTQMCPNACQVWESKITALAPSDAYAPDYISVLSQFYTTIYLPASSKPTEAIVDTFLASPAGTVSGVDTASLKLLIMDGFHIDGSGRSDQNFEPSDAALAPKMGVDEVRTRKEGSYITANPVTSAKFSEGPYAPVTQSNPLNPGQWEDGTSSWKGPRPASVCPCAENVM